MTWWPKGRSGSARTPAADVAVSRRELITGGFLRALAAAAAPVERASTQLDRVETAFTSPTSAATFPVLRPPGAIAEADFLAGCTRCGDCIRACPHQAIILAPARLRQAAGTPIIDPINQACLMCVDTPCITACAPAVLRRIPDAPVPAIGTARINTSSCLAHQGTTCSTCRERCPEDGAITIDRGRPTVVADRCTGCGICQHVCPAPDNAVLLLPLARRPGPESSHE